MAPVVAPVRDVSAFCQKKVQNWRDCTMSLLELFGPRKNLFHPRATKPCRVGACKSSFFQRLDVALFEHAGRFGPFKRFKHFSDMA